MKPDIEVTDEMAKRVYEMYYANMPGMYYAKIPTTDNIFGVAAMKDALEAALNPTIVLCKNCGNGLPRHPRVTIESQEFRTCPGYVWEPAS